MARKPKTPTPKTKAKKVKRPLKKGAAFRPKETQNDETPILAKVTPEPEVIDAEIVSPEETTKMGRPSKYKPEFALIAKALCRRGATDYELAEEFGVVTSTIWRWQCQYEDFCKAMEVGKGSYDRRIERSLAQRAAGYTYHTEKVFQFQGQIIRARVVEHMPADIGAAKMWLTNRDPANWREATQRIEHGQPGDFEMMDDEALREYIAAEQEMLIESKNKARGKPSTKH